jgi:hypothetical protein
MEQALAIARVERPPACLSLSTSLIFRMDNLFLAIVSSFLLRKRHDGLFLLSYPASLRLDPIPEQQKKWPESTGIGGRIAPEWVAGMNRNYWPLSAGICISDEGRKMCHSINKNSDEFYTNVFNMMPEDKRSEVMENFGILTRALYNYTYYSKFEEPFCTSLEK